MGLIVWTPMENEAQLITSEGMVNTLDGPSRKLHSKICCCLIVGIQP